MAEISLQSPAVLWALPVLWLLLLLFAWRRRFKPLGALLLRLTIVVLAVLAMARPVVLPPSAESSENDPSQRSVVLVDQSASLTPAEQQMLRDEGVRLAREFGNSTVLYFADRALLATQEPDLPEEEQILNREVSNLAGALQTGAELLNGQGRIVLLSDGLATEGDTLQAARQLAAQGILVDTVGLPETVLQQGPEVMLVDLKVPSSLREGETFTIDLMVHSSHQMEATLNLIQDDTTLAEDIVLLEPGLNLFNFEANAAGVGLHKFRAAIATDENDGQAINNHYSAFTQVYPAPEILVVGEDQEQMGRFASYLQEAGFNPDTILPKDLPDRISRLEPYAGMVLLNVSARSLKLEQMLGVQEFVRSLGRGLLVTGGRSSYSLGNYEDTPLAELLPLSLEPPPREERPPVALLLVIDHSGSMIERGTTTKLVMAKEAAIRATDILGPEDRIGVLMFDDQHEWIVPFQPVSDGAALLEIQRRIATIPAGGGTHILNALEEGLPALAGQQVAGGARHAVLLTDGRSFDGTRGIQDYNQLVDEALRTNITVSTIAIGRGADEALLTHLAERGLGRYHFAAEPEELPALTIAESAILRSNAVQEGEFAPAVYAPHPLLRGLFPAAEGGTENELPRLTGYVAMTPKPRAEVALQAGPGDPLLAAWGYGLGRVVAWSSDTGGEWGTAWSDWPRTARFWGQMVGYTLPAPDLGLLQVRAEVEPSRGVVTLTADGVTATGQTVDLVSTEAALITPGDRRVTVHLRQTEPGRYQQRLLLADPGAYEVRVIQDRLSGELDEKATIGFVVPYPAEYGMPADGMGRPLLEQISELTGGRYLALSESIVADTLPQAGDAAAGQAQELWPWLLMAALILWPVEIAWRRWGRLRIQ